MDGNPGHVVPELAQSIGGQQVMIRYKFYTRTMPVDFEEYFPEDGRIDLTAGTNARTLLSFLLEHQGVGFTPAELHGQTGIPRASVNSSLGRLERAGLVRHKGDYWAAEDDDRIAAATASVLGLAAVTETYDDDWYAHNEGWSDDLDDLSDEEG